MGAVAHLLDVGAGGEGLVAAGEHDGADRRVGVEGQELLAELLHQRVAQGVQRLRPVEADQPDPAMGFDEDVFILSHAVFLR